MKKTLSLLLAIIVAAVSICTLTICAFAEPDEVESSSVAAEESSSKAVDLEDPRDEEESSSKADEEESSSKADEEESSKEDESSSKVDDDVVTNPSGVTSIDDGDETSKKPANVDDEIPSTGSNVVLPAIALLALAGGVAVAVKSKKD